VDPGDVGREPASYRDGMATAFEAQRAAQGRSPRTRLLAGLPLEERRVVVAGAPTVLLEGGEGPTVLLLHGGIESGGAYWAPVVPRLAATHRLVVPDVPGLGESDPVARLDDDAFAEWLGALLRLTDEPPALVAHSLLGSLAARFAARQRNLLRQLVIYGSPGIDRYRMPPGLVLAAIRFDMRPTQRNHERFERWAFLDPDRTKQRDREWFEAFGAYCVSQGRVRHVKRAMRQLVKAGTRRIPEGDLRRIEIPTTLLWGRHDRMAPLRLSESASATLGWPLHVIEDAGHVPHLEQPEAFLDALRAVLDSQTSDQRR
jgi:2-hydroxymuconate-semialdehyde hydrolase